LVFTVLLIKLLFDSVQIAGDAAMTKTTSMLREAMNAKDLDPIHYGY
jgi:hypothetical protein|tara:strand:- start:424 stop:564 length:141 start_codon:yes stop_codon:yes gene_type:complete